MNLGRRSDYALAFFEFQKSLARYRAGSEEEMDESKRQGSRRMKPSAKTEDVQPTPEEELAKLLPGEPVLFMELLYEDYRESLVACVGTHGRGMLNEHDIMEAIQETFIAVWTKIREPSFDPDRPLRIIFEIARNKAIDARRKKFRVARRGANETDITDLIIADLAGTRLATEYRYADAEEKRRLDEALPDIVADLPERQRMAVNALLECYEEIRERNKYGPVADAMSRMCGEFVDTVAARSALRAGLAKVRSELARRGVTFVDRRTE